MPFVGVVVVVVVVVDDGLITAICGFVELDSLGFEFGNVLVDFLSFL